jgi:hypothetical protein
MDGVTIPFLPTTIWIFAAALAIILVLFSFAHYLYYQRRMKALIEDSVNAAELAAKKENLQADVNELRNWLDKQRDELNRVKAEREEQERLRALLDDLAQKGAVQDQKNEVLRKEVGELENQRHFATQTLEKLSQEVGNLEAQRGEAASLREDLRQLQKKMDDAQKTTENLANFEVKIVALKAEQVALDNQVKEIRSGAEVAAKDAEAKRFDAAEASNKLENVKSELFAYQRELVDLHTNVHTMQKEKDQLEFSIGKMQVEHTSIERKMNELQAALEKATSEVDSKRQESILIVSQAEIARNELKDIRQKQSELDAKVNSLSRRKEFLAEELKKIEDAIAKRREGEIEANSILEKLNSAKKERRREQEMVEELVARKALLEQRVIELHEALKEQSPSTASNTLADLLVEPACLKPQEFPSKPLQIGEIDALQNFQDQLIKEGLIFSDRVIKSFHTSLKCADINPLTVLAGVSGTGKTLLPIKYAQLMGMHSLVMAVQPRWDSPQDMFGFYNYLEKLYKSTEMAQALVRMDEYHSFMGVGGNSKDRMLMIIMDEMNLARTEYYFSEFLSKLELRREVKDPSDPSDRKKAEIILDFGPGGNETSRLWVGHNLIFVGTMNEDESTQSLSDKVLDRSNVLRFGKPANRLTDDSHIREARKADGYLPKAVWRNWISGFNEPSSWSRTVADWTEAINSALEKVGRPFGYRVEKAIRTYVANYPTNGAREDYKLAFADQIEQKILPKLRGLDLSEPNAAECLTQIQDVVVQLGDKELSDTLGDAIEMGNNTLFNWHGVSRK